MNTKRDRIAGCIMIFGVVVIIGDVIYNMITGSTPRDLHISTGVMAASVTLIGIDMLFWALIGWLEQFFQKPRDESPAPDA